MTFQRAIYGKTQYTYAGQVHHVLPTGACPPMPACSAWCWSSAIGLFLLALVVFGRLEGNFAEEL